MRQTFPDMEPAEIRTLKRVVHMSKNGLNTFCMETRLRELSLYFAFFEITNFCFLLLIIRVTFGSHSSLQVCHMIGHVTVISSNSDLLIGNTELSFPHIYIIDYIMAAHAITKAFPCQPLSNLNQKPLSAHVKEAHLGYA